MAADKTFTILHTNDIHSNLIGVGPVSEYTPATLNDDATIGGIERIATLIAGRRKAREADGPVLVLDIGDASIGTKNADGVTVLAMDDRVNEDRSIDMRS